MYNLKTKIDMKYALKFPFVQQSTPFRLQQNIQCTFNTTF